MGVGAAVVSTDWVLLALLWEAPTSPPHGDGCSDVEASGEMDVANDRWCYSQGCINWLVAGVPMVSPIEDVSQFDPGGLHHDGPPAREEL
jgi:hypothetical protein